MGVPLRSSFQKGLTAQLQGVSREPRLGSASSFKPRSWSSGSNPQPITEEDGRQGHMVLGQCMSKGVVQGSRHFCSMGGSMEWGIFTLELLAGLVDFVRMHGGLLAPSA